MTTDRNSEGAVLAQYRMRGKEGTWTTIPIAELNPHTGDDWEVRKLYTTPPASIPAAEVQALVEDWRKQARMLRNEIPNLRDGSDKRFMAACDAEQAADELAKLIPRNDE